MRGVLGVALVCSFLAMGQAKDAPSADDLARGKRLFESQCGLCHGRTGEGGRGPNLARPKLSRASGEASLVGLIQGGIPGTEMAGAWQMTQREVRQVAQYVLSLGRMANESLPGDAERGRVLYAEQGCATCHIVRSVGTGFGPELTEVGARRSATNLREHLTDPGKNPPAGFMTIRAATRDGRKISGVRVNEDTFTIQIQEMSGRFSSFRKSELTDLKKAVGESPMPSFRTLSAMQLDDLVAYLASLRSEK